MDRKTGEAKVFFHRRHNHQHHFIIFIARNLMGVFRYFDFVIAYSLVVSRCAQ